MRLKAYGMLLAISGALLTQSAGLASEKSQNKQWEEQETWTQFTEKEHNNSFKMSTPRATPKRQPTLLESVLSGNQPSLVPNNLGPNPNASAPSSGNFSVPAYICMPGAAPAVQQPVQRVETTIVPTIRRNSIVLPSVGFGVPYGGYGWGGHRYWGTGWGRSNWGVGPLSWIGGDDPFIGYRVQTRTRQVGPSRASGNYYMPSTPDPSASGNYYA